jgi:histidine triad (HIT) family protein
MSCIFCDIIAGAKPCKKVYEDEHVFAFHDIRPSAPVHVLVVPKKHIATLFDTTPEDQTALGHLTLTLPVIARQLGLDSGFKIHVNTGRGGGQEVFHVHYHLLGYKR